MAPASYSERAPKGAVFLSYAEADQSSVLDIPGRITRGGVDVFLDAACMRSDPEAHILNALSFADDVTIPITPTRAKSFNTRSTPAFLDRPYVWLAIGVASARGIPIRGLLKWINRKEVVGDPAIPRFIKDGELFDTVESYLANLLSRIPKARPKPIRRPASHCRVCLCQGGRDAPAFRKIEEQLNRVGIVSNRWLPNSNADQFDAAVVVFIGKASATWKMQQFRHFLQRFVDVQKPLAFLTLPGPPPEVTKRFRPALRIEYRESDNLSLLQLIWAIVGYRHYDIDIVDESPGIVEREPGEPLRVFISYSHKDKRLRLELETHLKLLQRQGVIAVWTDRKITAGDEWKGKIDDSLESADIILLLVSADFLASDYCYDVEMKQALKLHEARRARVIPIILRDVDWQSAPFGKLRALPEEGKPVTLWGHRTSAWKGIAADIRTVAGEIRSHKSGRSPGL